MASKGRGRPVNEASWRLRLVLLNIILPVKEKSGIFSVLMSRRIFQIHEILLAVTSLMSSFQSN